MARVEFFRYGWSAMIMRALGTFAVDRARPSHKSMRRALNLLADGEVVGIFPEGGVAHGDRSIIRGVSFKLGVCMLAQRAGVPIVPVVVRGTSKLTRYEAWLPAGRSRIWMAFGQPILPRASTPRRMARIELGNELARQFQSLHVELCSAFNLPDVVE